MNRNFPKSVPDDRSDGVACTEFGNRGFSFAFVLSLHSVVNVPIKVEVQRNKPAPHAMVTPAGYSAEAPVLRG